MDSSSDDESSIAADNEIPLYVSITKNLCYSRGIRIFSSRGCVHVSFDTAHPDKARLRYDLEPEETFKKRRVTRVNTRKVLLSVRVTRQVAQLMPIDIDVTILNAPRPYTIRRNVDCEVTNEELMPESTVAYINTRYGIGFCSLDAMDFDATTLQDAIADSPKDRILVSKTYSHAELLRQVAIAEYVETSSPIGRMCNLLPAKGPREGSDYWVYEHATMLYNAINFISGTMEPATRITYDEDNEGAFDAHAFDGKPWNEAFACFSLDPLPPRYEAKVYFTAYFAIVG